MSELKRREPGDQIEGVFQIGSDPYVVVPMTVVTDCEDRIAHFIAAGTIYLYRTHPDGSSLPRVMTFDEFHSTDSVLSSKAWQRNAVVTTGPNYAHSVRTWWTPEWSFGGWYVNLQEPLRRTCRGFTTRDQFLDILVAPDGTWEWKDEDELTLAVERGRLTAAEAGAVRAEGERVVSSIERGAFPFDRSLLDWRPDPAWRTPTLHSDWLNTNKEQG